jgi:hypothetical protein
MVGYSAGLDQRPVERGEQQQRASALLEAVFDLGEVVEVIQHGDFLSLGQKHTICHRKNPLKPCKGEHVKFPDFGLSAGRKYGRHSHHFTDSREDNRRNQQ